MSRKAPVRVVVLGNRFASHAHLPALRWAGDNEVVGLAGVDSGRLETTRAEWDLPRVTTDWTELVELAPDLAIICTPVHLHASMVTAFMDCGSAVLCEKPFALDAEEARALVALAEGKRAWINHQLRFNPARRHLRELLAEGAIGRVFLGQVRMNIGTQRYASRPWTWWFDAERGGGILGALASHMLDGLRWLLGEIDSVAGRLEIFTPNRPDAEGVLRTVTADEHAHFSCRMENGAVVHVETSIAQRDPHSSWIEFTGTEGVLRLVDEDQLWRAPADGDLELVDLPETLPPAEELGMPDGGPFTRALPLFLRELLGAVRDGTPLEGAATFADGLAVQRVLDAVRVSSADGGSSQPAR